MSSNKKRKLTEETKNCKKITDMFIRIDSNSVNKTVNSSTKQVDSSLCTFPQADNINVDCTSQCSSVRDFTNNESSFEYSKSKDVCKDTSVDPKNQKPGNNSKHKVGYDDSWEVGRPWLKTECTVKPDGSSSLGMYCSLCRKFNLKSQNGSKVWATVSNISLRLDRVLEHQRSSMHQEAVILESEQPVLETNLFISPAEKTSLIGAMKTLEFLIIHNLPVRNIFPSFVEFATETLNSPVLKLLNKSGNCKYTSPAIQNEMVNAMVEVCEEQMLQELRSSTAAAILIDETTDISTRKHLAIGIKYINSAGVVVTTFLKDVEVENGSAECITNTILNVCNKLTIPLRTFQAIGTDGASVMTGAKNGVVQKLKAFVPNLIHIHCHNHRLALAIQSSFEEMPLLSVLSELIQCLYSYYHYSSVKSSSLKAIQDLLHEMKTKNSAKLKLKKIAFTRWMSHDKAVSTIVKTYLALCTDLENAVASKMKTTGNGPTPEGLLKKLKTFKVYFAFCYLSDVLHEVTSLNLLLEGNDVHVADLETQLALTVKGLERLKKNKGLCGRKAEKNAQEMGIVPDEPTIKQVTDIFQMWITKLITCIKHRFESEDIIFAFGSLDLSKSQIHHDSAFGNEKLSILAEHFDLEEDEVMYEWAKLKDMTEIGNYTEDPTESVHHLFKFILEQEQKIGSSQFKNIKFLLAVSLILPLSTAALERVFSQVKRIVTDSRNRLEIERVSHYLTIKFRSPEGIDFEKAVKLFCNKKNRRIMAKQ